MVLATALIIGAAAYVHNKNNQANEREPAFDMEGKKCIEILPHENTFGFLEPPISTIAFFDGNHTLAAQFLKERVQDILQANPWLAGWIHSSGGQVKIWYDEAGQDVAPGIFGIYPPIQLLAPPGDTTDYNQILEAAGGNGVRVKLNSELFGANEPFFRVSIIPDATQPLEKFALVVSLSHVGGDAHSFFRIFNMLSNDEPIVQLNPVRKHGFMEAVQAKMGVEEATWLQRVAASSVEDEKPFFWSQGSSSSMRASEGPPEKQLFLISRDWLQEQKKIHKPGIQMRMRSWIQRSKKKSATTPTRTDGDTDHCFWDLSFFLPTIPSQNAVVEVNQQEKKQVHHEAADAFDSLLTDNDILVSWFWRIVKPTVGLMAYNFRNRLDANHTLLDIDMGNYQNPIPYTAEDYKTPQLIHQSIGTARRAGADRLIRPTVLPGAVGSTKQIDRISISTNWSTNSQKNELLLDESIQQTLSFPLYDESDFDKLPSNVTFFMIFNAGGSRLGAFVIAPNYIMESIESSGIIQESLIMRTYSTTC